MLAFCHQLFVIRFYPGFPPDGTCCRLGDKSFKLPRGAFAGLGPAFHACSRLFSKNSYAPVGGNLSGIVPEPLEVVRIDDECDAVDE